MGVLQSEGDSASWREMHTDEATGAEAWRLVAVGTERPRALPLPSGTLVCPAQQPYDGLTLQALGRPGARAWSCQELGCLQRWGLASGTSKKPHPQMFGPFPSFWIVCSVSGL